MTALDNIKAALEAGPTECGEWRWWLCKSGNYKPDSDYVQLASGMSQVAQVRTQSITEADLRYIAACNPPAIRELLAYVESLEKDAGRYRHLRDSHPADGGVWVAMGIPNTPAGVSCWRHEKLDAAIDAAMEQTK